MSKKKRPTAEMTFWEHFIELSKRFRTMLFAVLITTVIAAALPMNINFSNPLESHTLVTDILRQIRVDLLPGSADLIAYDPLDPVWAYMMIALIMGLIFSMPVIAYEFYKFFNPALYAAERKFLYSFIAAFVLLFSFGVAIAYIVVIPITFWVLWMPVFTGGVTLPLISIRQFITTVFWMCIATGFMFITPIIFVLLVRQGFLKSDFLSKRRMVIYGGGLIVAMILTPDPTPITAFIICLPLFVVLEVALRIARRYEKERA